MMVERRRHLRKRFGVGLRDGATMGETQVSELDFWSARLAQGVISRKEFMGRAAGLGASATLISGLLARIEAVAAETPRKGGVLRLGLAGGNTTDSVDVTTYNDSVWIDAGRGLFNGIVEWGQDGKPHPELAEGFEPKNGAKDWIFNLRKGVRFSNGPEFTADDAVYSLNLHRGDTKSGGAGSLKAITDVKKLDKYQIQISLAAPDADLPYALTDYHVLMVPDGFKDWAINRASPIRRSCCRRPMRRSTGRSTKARFFRPAPPRPASRSMSRESPPMASGPTSG